MSRNDRERKCGGCRRDKLATTGLTPAIRQDAILHGNSDSEVGWIEEERGKGRSRQEDQERGHQKLIRSACGRSRVARNALKHFEAKP
jgi:hypothetical protein